jgi:Ca2+/Na+ antiporter
MLKMVIADVKEFLVVMAIFLLAFTQVFWFLFLSNRNDEDDDGDDEDDAKWGTLAQTFFTGYNMMLGNFDTDDFTVNREAVILFVLFMIMVVIVMMNVLIAIVSDSYDVAMVNSSELYHFGKILCSSHPTRNPLLFSF